MDKTPLGIFVDVINSHLRRIRPKQSIPLRGQIDFHLVRANGAIEDFSINNLIMDAGENEVAKLICGVAADPFDYIAIGTGDTAPADSQTELVAEIATNGGARKQDSSTGVAANVATIDVTYDFTGELAIKEVGLFNKASAGDMLARQVFAVINVDDGDHLTVSWSITAGVAR